MHIFLLTKVSILAQVVLLSCETREAIFVNVQSKWIDRGKRDVHSQVKFVAIDEQRLVHVLTDDHRGALWNLSDVLSYEDALALRGRSRLADPRLVWLLGHRVLQLDHLIWQNERLGKEFEMLLTYRNS